MVAASVRAASSDGRRSDTIWRVHPCGEEVTAEPVTFEYVWNIATTALPAARCPAPLRRPF